MGSLGRPPELHDHHFVLSRVTGHSVTFPFHSIIKVCSVSKPTSHCLLIPHSCRITIYWSIEAVHCQTLCLLCNALRSQWKRADPASISLVKLYFIRKWRCRSNDNSTRCLLQSHGNPNPFANVCSSMQRSVHINHSLSSTVTSLSYIARSIVVFRINWSHKVSCLASRHAE